MGRTVATTEEHEDIVFADVDTAVLEEARKGIPVTTQRRFDVCEFLLCSRRKSQPQLLTGRLGCADADVSK